MSLKRRVYSEEFKAKVLREVASGKTIAEVTRAFSLSKNVVYDWRNKAASGADSIVVSRRDFTDMELKLAEYERLVGRMSIELEVLKKLKRLKELQGSENN